MTPEESKRILMEWHTITKIAYYQPVPMAQVKRFRVYFLNGGTYLPNSVLGYDEQKNEPTPIDEPIAYLEIGEPTPTDID